MNSAFLAGETVPVCISADLGFVLLGLLKELVHELLLVQEPGLGPVQCLHCDLAQEDIAE